MLNATDHRGQCQSTGREVRPSRRVKVRHKYQRLRRQRALLRAVMVLAPMVLLCLGLSRGPSQDEQPIAAAPVSSTDAPVRSAVLRTASRPIYPYSVIRGGA